jgi:hypothetical protein
VDGGYQLVTLLINLTYICLLKVLLYDY